MNKPIIYIDGFNVFMRHYAANPTVSLHNKLCGGIVGTLKNIEYLCTKFSPSKIVIAWEGGGSARRRNIDPNYKEGRRPVKLNRSSYYEDLKTDTVETRDDQLKTLIEILYKTPVTQIYVNDCEADDVIAYLCKSNMKHDKIIVTSDKDYYQLVDKNTFIWSPNKKKLIDEEYIIENWNIHPTNFCVARCFSGDQSDGIKGVKGAGFKTMAKRFPDLMTCTFLSINDIISISNDEVKNGSTLKLYRNIINEASSLHKNWRLMHLDTAMLSADQVKKINHQVDNKKEKLSKLDLMRIMNREGLNNFDIHTFLLTLKSYLRGN